MRRTDRSLGPPSLIVLLTGTIAVIYTNHAVLGVLLLELAGQFDTTVSVVSQLIAITGLAWGLSAPLMGPFSDRLGRRPLFFFGHTLLAVFNLASALAPSFPLLLACRAAAAIGGGAVGPSTYAIVADAFPPARRGQVLSWVMLGFSVSTLAVVPALALLAASAGWRTVFVALTLASLAVMAVAWKLVPPAPAAPPVAASYPGQLGAVLRQPAALVLLLGNITHQGAANVLLAFLPAFLMQTFGLGW